MNAMHPILYMWKIYVILRDDKGTIPLIIWLFTNNSLLILRLLLPNATNLIYWSRVELHSLLWINRGSIGMLK